MTPRTDSPFGHEERESSHHSPRPAMLGGIGLLLALFASMVAFAPTVSAGGSDRHDGKGDRTHGVTVECQPEAGTWSAVFRVKNWKGGLEGYTSFDDASVLDGRHMRVTAVSTTAGSLSGLAVGDVLGDSSAAVTVSGIPVTTTSVSIDVAAEWRWYTVVVDSFTDGHVEIEGKFYGGLVTKADARTKTAHAPEGCEAPQVVTEPDVIIVPPVVPTPPAPPVQPDDDDAAVGGIGVDAGVDGDAGVVGGAEVGAEAGVVAGAGASTDVDSAAVAGIGVEAGVQVAAGAGTLPRTGLAAAPLVMAATALLGLGALFRVLARRSS